MLVALRHQILVLHMQSKEDRIFIITLNDSFSSTFSEGFLRLILSKRYLHFESMYCVYLWCDQIYQTEIDRP